MTECFWTPRRRPEAVLRAVCFPHAGGDAPSYEALARALPDHVEVLAVRMPRPGDGVEVSDLAGLVGRIVAAGVRVRRPYMMVGQSLGGLIAFETARAMSGSPPVACLIVSSAPPRLWAERFGDHTPDDHRVLARMWRGDERMREALNDPVVHRLILRDLWADLRLLRGYAASAGPLPAVPVRVLVGADDPGLTAGEAAGWARCTSGGCSVRSVPSGHFVVQDAEAFVVEEITRVAARISAEAEGE
ncbi:Surfactin synthase thioesterase subunit [Nonomuraea solani]|uniref:Surfactin synthase thioesterase subunit n=1 Tax=Nonomuraea solani TaxID=1144553 RepID=A0A1H6EYF1_9ACTN|nr:alpha/beta fold hydrolase [Nonomuraea solani]SEH02928.1 Surfactin synthase thioesterase subunit [Nonomuraea solani]